MSYDLRVSAQVLGRASITDLKSQTDTPVFTADRACIVTQVVIRCTAASAITVPADVSVG